MSNIVILLTACINPDGMCFTTLQDVEIRRKQYIGAVSHYLEHTKYNIVLCNNSGIDKELFDAFKGENSRLELLFFHGNNYDKSYGKGYGEYEIIRYALRNSTILPNADFIIKITGRYIISNLVQSIKLNNCIIRKKDILYYNTEFSRGSWCDSRCFYASRTFFEQFLVEQNNINDSDNFCFENKLYNMIQQSEIMSFPFLIPLIIIGMSGTSGVYYDLSSSVQKRATNFFNNCEIMKSQLSGLIIRMRINIMEFVARLYWYSKKTVRIVKRNS